MVVRREAVPQIPGKAPGAAPDFHAAFVSAADSGVSDP
jgi:hypothetical protein